MPPHEHDDDVVSPFRPSHVHEPWPYVCASRRSRPHPYVHIRGRIFFLAPWPLYVHVHATCAPLLRHVRASTTTRARLYIDQYICTYTFATRMTTLRTLRPGGSRLSGTSLPAKMWLVGPSSQGRGIVFFCPDALPCVRRCSWWVPAVRGETLFSRNMVARPVGPCCQVEE